MNYTWLRAGRYALFAIAVACVPLGAQQVTLPAGARARAAAPGPTAARAADVASPEAVVTAIYRIISGPAGRDRDWDRFRALFLPDARLVFILPGSAGEQFLFNLTVDEFIELAGPGYQSGAGFWEREIGHHVDRFATIAQVFSTYESRLTGPNGPVSERGINSIQLLRYENRWWITSLVFDAESAANPIPPEYLNLPNE
jgi:hypothetical protein